MGKFSAKGLKLQVEIATVMTTVGECSALNGPTDEVQFWDATDLESTYVEDGELADLVAPGEVSGTCFCDPDDAGQAQLQTDVAAGGSHRNFQFVYPTTGTPAAAFVGSAKNFNVKGSAKGGFEADFAIKQRSPAAVPA